MNKPTTKPKLRMKKKEKDSQLVAIFKSYGDKFTEPQWKPTIPVYHDHKPTKVEQPDNGLIKRTFKVIDKPSNSNGQFVPFFTNPTGRTIYYVAGRSGSGKSFLAKEQCKFFQKLGINCFVITGMHGESESSFPGAKILDIDELVDLDNSQEKLYREMKIRYKHKKKGLDSEQKVQFEIHLDQLKDDLKKKNFRETLAYHQLVSRPSFWIYDDLENSKDERIHWLRTQALIMGRRRGINMCVINHLPKNGCKTGAREVILESHVYIMMAPFSRQVESFLKTYMSFDDTMLRAVRELLCQSRYVAVYRDLNYLIAQHRIVKY